MSNYLVTLKPMEPYFFGGERTFGFGETINKEIEVYNNYFIRSEELMSQTTFLGALRFLILKMNDKLNLPSSETEDLIGETSFSFEEEHQDFGKIKSVSPLFLLQNNGDYYIKTPFNHNAKYENYTPLKMDYQSAVKTSIGETSLPIKGEFDPKEGVANSFMNLSTGEIYEEVCNEEKCNKPLFKSHIQTGIKKILTGNKEDQNNSFFKKEYKTLNSDFKFAFFVEIDDLSCDVLPEKDMVILGQGKSLFEFSCRQCINDLEDKIKDRLKCDESFYYAISDIFPNASFYKNKENKGFYIAEKKFFRNLNSDMSKDNYYESLKKSKLYTLIKAGSVFYYNCIKDIENKNLERVGFNKYVKIEGGKR